MVGFTEMDEPVQQRAFTIDIPNRTMRQSFACPTSIASARRFASKASNSSSKALILSRSASNGFSDVIVLPFCYQ
ncbi:hypothetical protein SEEH4316_13286 [Salmonella enterica subsp. enterica serovar Heidelberg str. RI-11-014316]|nr:hypothetical protein SEEH4316_13286 [Salmonella enterica subsp. enterica serovar Heidelberg str. RI-11-014316]